VALDSGQPVGDLCDLLGISRCNPGVFDAMLEIIYGEEAGEDARAARLAALARRLRRRA
jgi:hypothetical protein